MPDYMIRLVATRLDEQRYDDLYAYADEARKSVSEVLRDAIDALIYEKAEA